MAGPSVSVAEPYSPSVGPWLSFPLAGHAILTIDTADAVTSCNEGARLLFSINPDDRSIHAADLFGPPVGMPGGVRALLDEFARAPDGPLAWTGNLTCFRGPGKPFVVTATATASREVAGPAGSGSLTVVCGPGPSRNAGLPAAGWLPPDLSRQIGHELRSSFSGIAGLAAIVARRAGGAGTEPDELRRLRMIEQNARCGIATVDRVVALTQIESGRTPCHKVTVDVRQILAAAIGMCAALASPARRVHAETAAEMIALRTDPVLLTPVVAELITNALVAGGATEVHVRAVARGGTTLIEVTDDGCGVPPDEQRAIFDPFVRGESSADGAAGLGLHLARRRAQLIGAELTLLSSGHCGSTFTIALPSGEDDDASTGLRGAAGGRR
jgi:anti-sigma regulatory factor (Ser/Thr protein kinase)